VSRRLALRIVAAAIVTAACLGGTERSLSAQAPPPGSGPIEFNGFVRVIDGDSVEIYVNGSRIGIGIVGIRTPMGNTSCGQDATGYLWSLLSEPPVRFEEDPVANAFDRRKRRMYRVVLRDGRSAAVVMAEAGYAMPTGEGIETNEISAAVGRARRSRFGCPVPPVGNRQQ
jgi:endonuclease YncB( thermonuclease family)